MRAMRCLFRFLHIFRNVALHCIIFFIALQQYLRVTAVSGDFGCVCWSIVVFWQRAVLLACDGRHSTLREASGLGVREFGSPIDVLWLRVSRRADDS